MKQQKHIFNLFLIFVLFLSLFTLCSCGFLKTVNCEHVWEEEVETEATCTTDGVMLKTCTICGKTMHEKIQAGGHLYEEKEKVDATCTEDGHITKECKVCHDVVTETLPAKGHTIVDGVGKEATCTEDGYKAGVCIDCNEITRQVLPALGHDYTEWEIITEATSSNTGLKKRTCNRCGNEEEEIIPMVDYIDLGVLEYDFSEKPIYDASSEEELTLLYSSAILNRLDKIIINIKYRNNNLYCH